MLLTVSMSFDRRIEIELLIDLCTAATSVSMRQKYNQLSDNVSQSCSAPGTERESVGDVGAGPQLLWGGFCQGGAPMCRTEDDALWHDAVAHEVPQGDEQLAGQGDDHLLARGADSLGASFNPL